MLRSNPHPLLAALLSVIALQGCAASEAESEDSQDAIELTPEETTIERVLVATGDYSGTHEGRACTVSVNLMGSGAHVTMWHDDDVDANHTVRGDFFKFQYGPSEAFKVHEFTSSDDSFYADVEEEEDMAFAASRRSKIWASSLKDPSIASVRIRQGEKFFGFVGQEMTCANLVPKANP